MVRLAVRVTVLPVGANCTDIVQLAPRFNWQEVGVTWNWVEVSAAVAVPSRLPVLVTVNFFAALVPPNGADRDRDVGVAAKIGVLAALADLIDAHKATKERARATRATLQHLGVWDDIRLPPCNVPDTPADSYDSYSRRHPPADGR